MNIQIKLRFSDKILFEGEYNSKKEAVEDACKKGAYLEGADLGGADLKGANLEGAYLEFAYLECANLGCANLRGAYLEGAYLKGANLECANLRGAYLEGAYLWGADLKCANLEGAYLWGEKLVIAPVFIHGLNPYDVMITDKYIKIGCEVHKWQEWRDFSNKEMLAVEGKKALKFWNRYKSTIMTAAKAHGAEVREFKKGGK